MKSGEIDKGKIVVMGGYGQVGGYLSRALAAYYPKRVIAAGRSLEKAKAFEKSTRGMVEGRAYDTRSREQMEHLLEEASVVIMCYVPKDNALAEQCINKGVHYIDISPSYKVLQPLEAYQHEAEEKGAAVILGVGICPGLTNLMVKSIKEHYGQVSEVESTMMLGVGESYGMDAVDWLLNNLYTDIVLEKDDDQIKIKPFRKGRKVSFLDRKPQTAYPIDLADQHIVPKTLGISNIESRFCYDVSWITRETAIMARLKLMRKGLLLKGIKLANKMHIGTDYYALNVKAKVKSKEKSDQMQEIIFEISGNDNAKMTAYVAAATVCLLLEGPSIKGVHYLEDIISLEGIIPMEGIDWVDMDASLVDRNALLEGKASVVKDAALGGNLPAGRNAALGGKPPVEENPSVDKNASLGKILSAGKAASTEEISLADKNAPLEETPLVAKDAELEEMLSIETLHALQVIRSELSLRYQIERKLDGNQA